MSVARVDGISGGVLVGRAMSLPELFSFVRSSQPADSKPLKPETQSLRMHEVE